MSQFQPTAVAVSGTGTVVIVDETGNVFSVAPGAFNTAPTVIALQSTYNNQYVAVAADSAGAWCCASRD